ncbi:DUF2970 domain-containing protein [Saccharospirillum mangrovi]|uniref:DUF2970 domain-containing protein n=1 Tax=Saccharospirillum mangrovi TaxID=2161747 RepID=UPI001E2FBF62|nr:DUF2970 domain-containing protein [Saccharospirillum mangrovi]
MSDKSTPRPEGRMGLKRLVLSLLAGLVGVQSDKNRINDFQSTSIWPFIIGGVVLTIGFVLALILLVRTLAP